MLRGGAVVVYCDNIYHSSTNHIVQISIYLYTPYFLKYSIIYAKFYI